MITYQELRRMQTNERDKKSVQKIDSAFFSKVKRYLVEKKALLEKMKSKKDNIFSKGAIANLTKEVSNTEAIFKDIIERREKKVLLKALMDCRLENKDAKNLLDHEIKMYEACHKILCDFKNDISKEEKKGDSLHIKILKSIPKFKWKSNLYGPFSSGDKINLPKKMAEILINGEKAELVD